MTTVPQIAAIMETHFIDADKYKDSVAINENMRLFVVDHGSGYSCTGFDVCSDCSGRMRSYLSQEFRRYMSGELLSQSIARLYNIGVPEEGTLEQYAVYRHLLMLCEKLFCATKIRCTVMLHPQLVGFEGSRVEIVDADGETHRFWVSKSMGWMPSHIMVKRRGSMGGEAVDSRPYKSVRRI